MKHLAQIQSEFLKVSGDLATHDSFDSWSYDQQKKYLQQHPDSKKRITAKPPSAKYQEKFPKMKKYFDQIEQKKKQMAG